MSPPDLVTVASTTPRETGGADAFRNYDFQVNVSIARILDLHLDGKPYVAVFDHHDDLVLYVGEGDDAELSFYQIKATSELTWTPKRLASRGPKGDLPRSIIGKAYYNVVQFGSGIRRAAILSNRPLNATLAAARNAGLHDGELAVAELCSEDHGDLVASLKQDFPRRTFDPADATILTFERVPFDPESHRATVLGNVVTFLEKHRPEFSAHASPFYETLLAAVGDCTGNKVKSATVEELLKRVSLKRDDIDRMVIRIQKRVKTVIEWWESVVPELVAAGYRSLVIERVRVRCLAYWSARQGGERSARDMSRSIRSAMSQISLTGVDSVLEAAAALRSEGVSEPASELFDLEAALIVEVMEAIT